MSSLSELRIPGFVDCTLKDPAIAGGSLTFKGDIWWYLLRPLGPGCFCPSKLNHPQHSSILLSSFTHVGAWN